VVTNDGPEWFVRVGTFFFSGSLTPVVVHQLPAGELPTAFDWRNVDGVRYATPSKTQQVPRICGACWAFAATGTLSDRVRIAAKGTPVDVSLSPQTLLDCHMDAGSCNGGSSLAAFTSVHDSTTGFTDETCSPYEVGCRFFFVWQLFANTLKWHCRAWTSATGVKWIVEIACARLTICTDSQHG
jgi:hypothetical protein